ncbi:PREDICTED: intermediate filament protein ifa-1-like [Priapulus caudatus]|uniref:Intermediate filament protein ifa-1-like n=1 Tax=Priapulus caudatus TaxID=37621 RepID=A0ABM1E1V8_PRICU
MSSSETITRSSYSTGQVSSDDYGLKSNIQPRGSAIRNLADQTSTIMSFTGDMSSPMAVVAHREREKRDLSDLNDRLCNYIEAVRFLEFHNKKLSSDVEFYKTKLERLNIIIRQIFETELNQAREIVEDNRREKDRLDERHGRLDRDANEFRDKFHKLDDIHSEDILRLLELEDQMAQKIAIINGLLAKIKILEDEIARLKREYNRLLTLVNDTKIRNEEEIMIRKDLEHRIPGIQEEIAFKQQLHEQELRELLDSLMKDDTDIYRNIFHNELSSALRDIRKEYEEQMAKKPRNEEVYQTRIQEIIKTTAKKSSEELSLKDQARKDRTKETEMSKDVIGLKSRGDHLRRRIEELERVLTNERSEFDIDMKQRDEKMLLLKSKLEDMLREMQEMLDEKLRLDEEITTYRRLLSGEETRMQESMVEASMHQAEMSSQHAVDRSYVQTIESAVKTNIQKRSKGTVAFGEANLDDNFIVMENTTRDSDQKMDGWQIRRNDDVIYTFPPGSNLKAGRNQKVTVRQWTGDRTHVMTSLHNERGDDVASQTQRSQ